MAQSLSDAQVRYAKELLLKGVSPVQISRLLDCSVETIRRYKRGESRTKVTVEGEEALRPPLEIEAPQEKVNEAAVAVEADASLSRLLQGLNGVSQNG